MIGRNLDKTISQSISKQSQNGLSSDVFLLRYREFLPNQCDCVNQTLQGAPPSCCPGNHAS
jgi:hypothetical protein